MPMDNYRLGPYSVGGDDGDLIHGKYTAQPDGTDTSHARQTGDEVMNDTFDFQGYYGNNEADTIMTVQPQQDSASNCQDFDDSQRDQDTDVDPQKDFDSQDYYEHEPFDAALMSYYSGDILRSSLIPSGMYDLEEDTGPFKQAHLATADRDEKWDVDAATMELMTSVLALSAPVDTLLERCDLRLHLRDAKLEEPVLTSDAATDMQRLRERNIARLTSESIKPFPPNKRHDQDLHWSARSLRLPDDMERAIAAEKMIISSETGSLLKAVFEVMNGEITASLSKEQHKAFLRRVTPPLLPLSPPYSPGSIPSTAARLPFTSTPQDPLIREGMEIEAKIMATEDLEETSADDPQMHLCSPSRGVAGSSSSPLRRKFDKISDLKMSSPLLPVELPEPPTKKTKNVTFADEIQTLVPRRDSDNVSTDPFVAADQALAAVSAIVEPLVQAAMERVNNEQLIELDTVARVDVPSIEDITIEVQWALYCGRDHVLLGDIRAGVPKMEKRWSGASSLERLLPWSPFPAHLGKPKPEGDFDDGSIVRYLSDLDIEEDVDARQMVWKPEGLRIFDLDDEEKLAVCDHGYRDADSGHKPSPQRVQTANMVPQDHNQSLYFPSSHFSMDNDRGQSVVTAVIKTAAHTESRPQILQTAVPKHLGPEVNSMQALLEKRRVQLERERVTVKANPFSGTICAEAEQASMAKKPEASASYGNLSTFMAVQGVREAHDKATPVARQAEGQIVGRGPMRPPAPAEPKVAIPAPPFTYSRSRLPVVVSSAAMANRSLLRRLQQQLPAIDVVERETTRSDSEQIRDSSAREADLTLSPSVGLMFTTLQKLMQRPLPGQEAAFVGIREQFAQVAPRYERLIVLLSEGLHCTGEEQTHVRALDERDSAAIADFIGFFSRIDTQVQVSYVPGGEDDLVKWIAAAVTRWAPHIEGFHLLDEETVWENFLRKAGMNVFAAQVVLDQLKPLPSQLDSEDPIALERYGLAAFVRMNVEERVQRFVSLIGGSKVLKRVSIAIDGSWNVGKRR